jgi:putative heme-binding domain-containing protein
VVEVLWPGEQVKEGYSLSRVTLKDQRVLQGYVQDGRDSKVLLLRDFSSTRIESVPRGDITRTEVVGSLMPGTAQTLSRSELADLLAYLFSLRGR